MAGPDHSLHPAPGRVRRALLPPTHPTGRHLTFEAWLEQVDLEALSWRPAVAALHQHFGADRVEVVDFGRIRAGQNAFIADFFRRIDPALDLTPDYQPAGSRPSERRRAKPTGTVSTVVATGPPTMRCGASRWSDAPATSAPAPTSDHRGLSEREITRCLKRYIAREVHSALTRPLPLAPRGAELRRLRTEAGLPLRIVAEQHDISVQRLARIERGLTRDPNMQTLIHAWLTETNIAQIAA